MQVACHRGGPEGDRGAVGVAEQACRLFDGVDDRGDVRELALDRIVRPIPALGATATVDRVDGKAIDERRDEEPEGGGPPLSGQGAARCARMSP